MLRATNGCCSWAPIAPQRIPPTSRPVWRHLPTMTSCSARPSTGGGYTLVGSSRPTPTLFDVTMSTTRVLQHTAARAERDGMGVHLLDRRGDLDTVDDLIIALDSGWLATAPLTAALADQLADRHRLSSPGLEAP